MHDFNCSSSLSITINLMLLLISSDVIARGDNDAAPVARHIPIRRGKLASSNVHITDDDNNYNAVLQTNPEHTISTTFSGGSIQSGCMFDLVGKKDITIIGIDIHITAWKVYESVEVWVKDDTLIGYEKSPEFWSMVGCAQMIGNGFSNPTTIPSQHLEWIRVAEGQIKAIYTTLTYPGGYMQYSKTDIPTGGLYTENDDVEVLVGAGKTYLFGAGTFYNRLWNGSLRYLAGFPIRVNPSDGFSCRSTMVPSKLPSISPTLTQLPSQKPTEFPSVHTSLSPSNNPSYKPISAPQSLFPSAYPSNRPSDYPSTIIPSIYVSDKPSFYSTDSPSYFPSKTPTLSPSSLPSTRPSLIPSDFSSYASSALPTSHPIDQPSDVPMAPPSDKPSVRPTAPPSTWPSIYPTVKLSILPTAVPSLPPSFVPSGFPSLPPSFIPSDQPSDIPSRFPSDQPSENPSINPSEQPSEMPSPTPKLASSFNPTGMPSFRPTRRASAAPTSKIADPTITPSHRPSLRQSNNPSSTPSVHPAFPPSVTPSVSPSKEAQSSSSEAPSSFESAEPSTIQNALVLTAAVAASAGAAASSASAKSAVDSDERNLDEELAKTDAADEVERKGNKSKTTKIKRATLTKNFNQHTNASKVALTKRGDIYKSGSAKMINSSVKRFFEREKVLTRRSSKDHAKSMLPVCVTASSGVANISLVSQHNFGKAYTKNTVPRSDLHHLLDTFHATPIFLPKLAPNMKSATVISWIKCESERVWSRDAIMIIDSIESGMKYITAPRKGYLAGILVEEGGMAKEGSHVAYIVSHRNDVEIYNACASKILERGSHHDAHVPSREGEASAESVDSLFEISKGGYSITG